MLENEQIIPRLDLPDVRMERFVTALLEQGNITAAAQAAGISYATARRWLAQGPVKEAYAETRRELMRAAMSKLAAAVNAAVDTLLALLEDGITPYVRVQAAQALLNAALKAQDALELDARLSALEVASKAA